MTPRLVFTPLGSADIEAAYILIDDRIEVRACLDQRQDPQAIRRRG